MSQLKNSHGLQRLRIRGFAKAKCRIIFAVVALNIKRLSNYVKEQGTIASNFQNLRKILSEKYHIWSKFRHFGNFKSNIIALLIKFTCTSVNNSNTICLVKFI